MNTDEKLAKMGSDRTRSGVRLFLLFLICLVCLGGYLVFIATSDSPPAQLPRKGQRLPVVQPGVFCPSPGARGASSSGVLMVCKPSDTDTRTRWRAA